MDWDRENCSKDGKRKNNFFYVHSLYIPKKLPIPIDRNLWIGSNQQQQQSIHQSLTENNLK